MNECITAEPVDANVHFFVQPLSKSLTPYKLPLPLRLSRTDHHAPPNSILIHSYPTAKETLFDSASSPQPDVLALNIASKSIHLTPTPFTID